MSNKVLSAGVGIVALGLLAALASSSSTTNSGSGGTPTGTDWSKAVSDATGQDYLKVEFARLQLEVNICMQNYINASDPASKALWLAKLAAAQAKLAQFLSQHPELGTQTNTQSTQGTLSATATKSTPTETIVTPYTTAGGQTFEITYHGVKRTSDGYEVYMEGRLITVCHIYADRVEVSHPSGWLTSDHETWYKEGHGSYHTEQYNYHVAYRDREAR